MLLSLLAITVAGGCVTSEEDLLEEGLPEEIAATTTVEEGSDNDSPQTDPTAFGNTCQDTEIVITNFRDQGDGPTAILVHRVEWYTASEGRWYSEDLPNTSIDYGATTWFWNEDLEHADGDNITKWRVFYNYLIAIELSDGSDYVYWSPGLYYQEINTTDEVCHDDDNFEMTVY